MFEQHDIDELNSNIEDWSKQTKQDIIAEVDRLGIQHAKNSPNKVPLKKALKDKVGRSSGLINRISYSMPRSAVFVHKGVGRGHPISNPRQAKLWFQPVVDGRISGLADIVADNQGNMIVNALKIK